MVFGFDPRKLIKDQQEEEKKKVETAIERQERLDKMAEETEAYVRKQSNIKESLDKAARAIREVKYAEKYGLDKWFEAKKKQDPEFELPDPFNLFGDTKSKTLEEEYGDKEKIKPQFASYMLDGTTGPIESKSIIDPFAGEIGQLESITNGLRPKRKKTRSLKYPIRLTYLVMPNLKQWKKNTGMTMRLNLSLQFMKQQEQQVC